MIMMIFLSHLKIIAVIISLHGLALVLSQQQDSTVPVCKGVSTFDLYFVLDSSGSVGNNYASNIVPFVRNVINRYAESGFRVAIMTFDSSSTVHLTLTPISDVSTVRSTLNRLENVELGGSTNLAPALTNVNSMTASSGNGAISIILIVTDGVLSDELKAERQAKEAREKGSTIIAIGVGSYNHQQLLNLTGSHSNQVFTVANFSSLNQLLDQVVEEICVVTNSSTKRQVNMTAVAIVVTLLILLALLALCFLLWCLFPLITGVIVGGVEKKKAPARPAPPRPPPPPPQAANKTPPRQSGRKWDIVDASYYGMRGAGGIRPAKVEWGGKGTTEEGAKLTRAKDAVKLGEKKIRPPRPAPPSSETMTASVRGADQNGGRKKDENRCCQSCMSWCQQCCGALTNKVKGYYTVAASYRPVFTYHGTLGRRVLCCPGPKIEEKLRKNGTTETHTNQRPMASRDSSLKHPHSGRPHSMASSTKPVTQQPKNRAIELV